MSGKRSKKLGSHHHYLPTAAKVAGSLAKLPGIKVVIPLKIIPRARPAAVRLQRSLPGAIRLFVTSTEGCQELLVMLEDQANQAHIEQMIADLFPAK